MWCIPQARHASAFGLRLEGTACLEGFSRGLQLVQAIEGVSPGLQLVQVFEDFSKCLSIMSCTCGISRSRGLLLGRVEGC